MAIVSRLDSICVEGLFGTRDYVIQLDPAFPTVLTGANGTGKSTLLSILTSVSTGDLRVLVAAPLRRLVLTFLAPASFTLERRDDDRLDLSWGDRTATIVPPAAQLPDIALPHWADVALRHPADDADVFRSLYEAAEVNRCSRSEVAPIARALQARPLDPSWATPPEWLLDLQQSFPVLYITDQRLIAEGGPPGPPVRRHHLPGSSRRAVAVASADVAERRRLVDFAFARESQQQDRQFPQAVLRAMRRKDDVPSIDAVARLSTEVERQRAELREAGFLDATDDYDPIDPEHLEQEQMRPVLAAFLTSTLRKLSVLRDETATLRAFKSFLDRQLANKQVRFDHRLGLVFELSTGRTVAADQLSSGEQQLVVLAFEILFRAAPGTVVLIDEPEISLHVLWQDALIDELEALGRSSQLQFILATHSPTLLGGHPELERSLDVTGP